MSLLSLWNSRFPNFAPSELLSPDGLMMFDKGHLLLSTEAASSLELFRSFIGSPLLVNGGGKTLRGYRSPDENKRAEGRQFSFHMQGVAFDITVPGMSVETLAARAIDFGWHGVGAYPKRGFVHVDLRPRLTRDIITWVQDD